MRIEFKMEGGFAHFPSLSKPVSIDCDQLPQEERAELEDLVERARFFELPSGPSSAPRGADYYQYTISVEAGAQRHTVKLVDPIEDPNLQKLFAVLRAKAKALLSAGRGRVSD